MKNILHVKHIDNAVRSLITVLMLSLAFSGSSLAGMTENCYVNADTSKSNSRKPLGSRQNPFGTLALVEAESSCKKIIVQYSELALNGGIGLKDGQMLVGQSGQGHILPVISNTTAANGGHGVQLASNNSVDNLHITETWNSGVSGGNVGDLEITNTLINRFALSEDVFPAPSVINYIFTPASGISVSATADAKIRIRATEVGDANASSISVYLLAGNVDIAIDDVIVRDQGHLASVGISPGIAVLSFGTSTVDLKIQNTLVSNIGGGLSNSDGLALLALENSSLKVLVDGYNYDNPDGDGNGSATGMEMGTFWGTSASFEATIKNSVIHDSKSAGIQIFDLAPGSDNFLKVDVYNNEIYNSVAGVQIVLGSSPTGGAYSFSIEKNMIVDPVYDGIYYQNGVGQRDSVDLFIEKNTITNAQWGLYFTQGLGASVASLNIDVGLGQLGSQGKNRVIGSQIADIYVETFDCCGFPVTPAFNVDAANNWWGSETGPAAVVEQGSATVNVSPFLTHDPEE